MSTHNPLFSEQGAKLMSEKKIKYLLGIDGGGTKTEFLLTDSDKKPIRNIVLGTSNPINAGIAETKSVLNAGITEICRNLNPEEISVYAGLAGGSSDKIKTEIHGYLEKFNFGAFDNGSDTDSTLEITLKGENGVSVIMGTGIVAFSQCDGVRHRTGGWGYFIDKGGSGFHYGADALNCAFSFYDGSGGSRLIAEMIEHKMNKCLKDAIPEIYSKGAYYIASFAPVIFEAYKAGDTEAERIIERNTREAAKLIISAHNFLNDASEKTVISGGLCSQKSVIKSYLLRFIENKFPIVFSDEPIVNGAVALAKSNYLHGDNNA